MQRMWRFCGENSTLLLVGLVMFFFLCLPLTLVEDFIYMKPVAPDMSQSHAAFEPDEVVRRSFNDERHKQQGLQATEGSTAESSATAIGAAYHLGAASVAAADPGVVAAAGGGAAADAEARAGESARASANHTRTIAGAAPAPQATATDQPHVSEELDGIFVSAEEARDDANAKALRGSGGAGRGAGGDGSGGDATSTAGMSPRATPDERTDEETTVAALGEGLADTSVDHADMGSTSPAETGAELDAAGAGGGDGDGGSGSGATSMADLPAPGAPGADAITDDETTALGQASVLAPLPAAMSTPPGVEQEGGAEESEESQSDTAASVEDAGGQDDNKSDEEMVSVVDGSGRWRRRLHASTGSRAMLRGAPARTRGVDGR